MSEKKKIPVNPNLQVEDFNPEEYVVDYTNSNGEKLSRLPFNPQLTWFWLRYPDGKISVETRPGKSVVIAKARVYANRNDPVDAFIAEGESSRGISSDIPSINPRNWAQTAAIATALRYAGFGLGYDLAGEEPETITGEWDSLMDEPAPAVEKKAPKTSIDGIVEGEKTEPVAPKKSEGPDYSSMTEDEALAAASAVVFTNGKFKGKTVAQALHENSRYAVYVLEHFDHEDPIYKAVKVVNDAAMRYAE